MTELSEKPFPFGDKPYVSPEVAAQVMRDGFVPKIYSPELDAILSTNAYWNLGRMGCHDVVSSPIQKPIGSNRYMRVFREVKTGNWNVEIDPA